MPSYVPPQRRNQQATEASSKGDDQGSERPSDRPSYPRDNRGEKGSSKGQDRAGGRFESLKEDGAPPNRGGGKGRDRREDRRDDDQMGGGDWSRRADGRSRGHANEEKTELEVFGEVKTRSTAGIDFDNYDAIPVQITGQDVEDIKPIARFSEAKLTEALFENLRRCGYDRPTPVQKHSIPIVAAGRDLMACAQTGSGKTCAFMVPCLESLLRSGPPANPMTGKRPKPMPCGLVLAPTRELAAQIHVESLKFSFQTGIRCCIVYGGADIKDQRMDLERGCDILIATPGRLTDMCDRGNVSLELIQFFILDEADRMLDMGFEPQVRQIVESTRMGDRSEHRRQSMMFSATFAREVQFMARDFLKDYVFITVGRVGSASELVTQHVVYAGDVKQKVRALEKAIRENLTKDGLAVVFVETKRSADTLELDLHESGVAVTAIHGDRSQVEREEALHAFKTGANPVLVATDVAARGLDIPNVALVVNFDMPKQLDDYVHRIGRTGRAGRKGVAVAFVNERCNYLPELGDLLTEAKQELPLWFSELCRSSARRTTPGKGRASRGFANQDLRLEEQSCNDSNANVNQVATPARGPSWQTPARSPNSWGNTGAEDAW